jgi:mannonate dehydratase
MTAIAAVDTALWDIKGKALHAPVYQLLGGASRDAVTVYGHASGDTIDDAVESVGRYVARGYKAVRAQCSVPGLARTYGIGRGDHYERAERGLVSETPWSSELYLVSVPPLFERLRREFGPIFTCCTTSITG